MRIEFECFHNKEEQVDLDGDDLYDGKRNMLAEYLEHDAPHLESLEVTWKDIFRAKESLPRLACLGLYYTDHFWDACPPWGRQKKGVVSWHKLTCNVRRLRGALRDEVLQKQSELSQPDRKRKRGKGASSRKSQSKKSSERPLLTAADVVDVASAFPFETHKQWSEWLSDAQLMERVAAAFNSCPWALSPDLPPNPTDQDYKTRTLWPAPPYEGPICTASCCDPYAWDSPSSYRYSELFCSG